VSGGPEKVFLVGLDYRVRSSKKDDAGTVTPGARAARQAAQVSGEARRPQQPKFSAEESLAELHELAVSAGGEVVGEFLQHRDKPDPATLIGRGKLQEIAGAAAMSNADLIIFDLDPDAAISWRTLADSASEVRRQLKSLGLESFLKTTGGKGLHVVVPIEAKLDWTAVKQFAHTFALAMEQHRPNLYLSKMSKAARKDRIFIDYLRNERGSTAIAPYSPRARAGAPVALPLSWTDLKLPKRPIFEVADFNQWKHRLARDPWKDILKTHQVLAT